MGNGRALGKRDDEPFVFRHRVPGVGVWFESYAEYFGDCVRDAAGGDGDGVVCYDGWVIVSLLYWGGIQGMREFEMRWMKGREGDGRWNGGY